MVNIVYFRVIPLIIGFSCLDTGKHEKMKTEDKYSVKWCILYKTSLLLEYALAGGSNSGTTSSIQNNPSNPHHHHHTPLHKSDNDLHLPYIHFLVRPTFWVCFLFRFSLFSASAASVIIKVGLKVQTSRMLLLAKIMFAR